MLHYNNRRLLESINNHWNAEISTAIIFVLYYTCLYNRLSEKSAGLFLSCDDVYQHRFPFLSHLLGGACIRRDACIQVRQRQREACREHSYNKRRIGVQVRMKAV